MRRTLTRAAIAAVSTLGLLATAGFSYARTADEPVDADRAEEQVSTGMLRAMQRDLGLDRAEALRRIASDQDASATERQLRTELGTSFAGAWIDDGGELHIATTEPARSGEAERIAAAGAIPARAEHSILELDRAMARLDDAPRPDTEVTGWYVDVERNTVVIRTRPGGLPAAETLVDRAGLDSETVRIERTRARPKPLYDVRGGDAYYIGGSGRCSIGFPVEGGFVTAGHCGRAGTAISGHNQVSLGSVAASVFPGRDYGWVRITNNQWVTTPYVNDYAGGTVTVSGSQEAAIGAQVCRSGSTTGWRCGTIQAKNQSVNYPEGTIQGLTRTTACAEPGDSGGSWLAGRQAQGVTSGGSGNCSSGGVTFFQPVNPILSTYGLSLITEGGGGEEPPPGTWSAGAGYSVGDQVTYDGVDYRCIQAHTAYPGWEPPNAPALWQRI